MTLEQPNKEAPEFRSKAQSDAHRNASTLLYYAAVAEAYAQHGGKSRRGQ
ncbi:MAG: hypothetical protein L0191_01940 [Acidobacteria bacterium]|nr:hypothetical protein [Acidobacteriota bacterium]